MTGLSDTAALAAIGAAARAQTADRPRRRREDG
jgi:hypothetical protein